MGKKLLKSTSTVSGMTMISRIMGFLRDIVFARAFGASPAFDAFLLAFKIPNFLRRLFAEGAFSQAFVPILSEYKSKKPEEVKNLVETVAGNFSIVLLLVTIVGMIAAPLLVLIFAPGFLQDVERFNLASKMLVITFPYIFFISLSAFFGGILNTFGRFAGPAFAPVLLNIALIFSAIGLSPYFKEPVVALAWGVFLGGILQLLLQIFFLRKINLIPRPRMGWHHPGVKRILTLMLPALLGASVMQVNLLVDTLFASFLAVGSLSWLYYSDRLLEFPLGVFGVALSTVILPHLSTHFANKATQQFSNSIDWALKWVMLVGVPATLGLIILAKPILVTLFNYGAFTLHDVEMASRSLRALSLGLVAFIGVKVLVSAFYARQNTAFPVKVALVAMLANVILNLLLIGPLQHAGLALASSISSLINGSVLLIVLVRDRVLIFSPGWQLFLTRLFIANIVMVFVLMMLNPSLDYWSSISALERGGILLSLISVGALAFFISLYLTGLRFKDVVTDVI